MSCLAPCPSTVRPALCGLTSVTQGGSTKAFDLHEEAWFGGLGEDTMENQTESLSPTAVGVCLTNQPLVFHKK